MGCLWRLIKLAVFLVLLGFLFKSYGAQWLMSFYLQRELGTEVSIGQTRIDYVNTQAKFEDIIIRNPMVFPEGEMILVSHLYLDLAPAALLKGKVLFETLDLSVREVRLVRTGAGLNLKKLKTFQEPAAGPGDKDFTVQALVLSLEHATFTDVTGERPLQKSFPLQIRNLPSQNVRGLRGILNTLAALTEEKTGVGL